MLALVKTAAGPGLELREVPQPTVGINDVLATSWSVSRTPIAASCPCVWAPPWPSTPGAGR